MARTGRPKEVLELTEEEREQLARWSRRAKSAQSYDELDGDWHRTERRVLGRTSNGRSGKQAHVNAVIWSQLMADRSPGLHRRQHP